MARVIPTLLTAFAIPVLLAACTTTASDVVAPTSSSVELRAIQARAFETADRGTVLRAVIATLQDLGFVVDSADLDIGTVTATKLEGYNLRSTVTARSRGDRTIVRMSAQYNKSVVQDPKPYQDFFTSLEKSLFLEANDVV
jgi:hypothetical protein